MKLKSKLAKKSTSSKTKPVNYPTPKIVEKSTRKVKNEDLVEVRDQQMVIAVELRRQSEEEISKVQIEDGQKLFPYSVLPRLFVGWQAVGFISSFEMKMSSEFMIPQMVIRFVEKMSPDDVKDLSPETRASIEAQINMVKQYPFIRVESPLLM